MKRSLKLSLAGTLLGLGVFSMADMTPAWAGPCPAVGADTMGCAIIITLTPGPNGTTIATNTAGPDFGIPYDGVEDTLIGVINSTGRSIGAITLSGSNIFRFDHDGLETFGSNLPQGGATTYEGAVSNTGDYDLTGPLTSFASITPDYSTGEVVFASGVGSAAGQCFVNGGSAFFSLEEALPLNGVTVTSSVSCPEPGGFGILGSALAGIALVRRRRKGAA